MEMIIVNSSTIAAIGYDIDTKKLVVEFHAGAYEYSDVPMDEFVRLITAKSKGSYFAGVKHKYEFRRL